MCSPYLEPDAHWELDEYNIAIRDKPAQPGRRRPTSFQPPKDQKTRQQALTLVDRKVNALVENIRSEVAKWREAGYPRVTATTRRLLYHWADPPTEVRPFFAQREAIETIIWLREVAIRSHRLRSEIETRSREHNDEIVRVCSKMATGTGKTVVMGMVIAWQTLNHATLRRTENVMHTDRFVVLTPGHTVRERLSALQPSGPGNIYDELGLVPVGDLRDNLVQAKVEVVNYQAFVQRELIGDSNARKILNKGKGEDLESPAATVRRVLGSVIGGNHRGVCVINDEAHHCYIPKQREKRGHDLKETNKQDKAEQKAEDGRASVWLNAIKTMRDMGVLGKVDKTYGQAHPVLDFSATPLWLDRASTSEPEMFEWVASDFGLMDAIESGLVKVPRLPIDDDSIRDETVWRRLYTNTTPQKLSDYMQNNNTGALPEPLERAVQSVISDWIKTLHKWTESNKATPPVVIFVADKIENAQAFYEYLSGRVNDDGSFTTGRYRELSNVTYDGKWHTTPRTLIVHSKIGESDDIPKEMLAALRKDHDDLTDVDAEAAIRKMLNTVGKEGQPGEQIRCVVSVSMLTEGWDARNVTHIVGYRAFGTQLLCEQVTGRALRRTEYETELDDKGIPKFSPEYAEVVGIPFEFMPSVGEKSSPKNNPRKRHEVKTVQGRNDRRVSFPHVVGYQTVAPQTQFTLNPDRVAEFQLSPNPDASMTLVAGTAGPGHLLDVPGLHDRHRSAQADLAAQIVEKLATQPGTHTNGPTAQKGRIELFQSAMTAVEQWGEHINVECSDLTELVKDRPQTQQVINQIIDACDFGSTPAHRFAVLARTVKHPNTGNVKFETALTHIHKTTRSELNLAACHSGLELATAQVLDAHPEVRCWVRNFQLGWDIPYQQQNETHWRRYEPDFMAVLNCGVNLILECKGQWDDKATAKADYTWNHWIPSIAGTPNIPENQRIWHYGIIDDPNTVKHQLDQLITEALAKATKQ